MPTKSIGVGFADVLLYNHNINLTTGSYPVAGHDGDLIGRKRHNGLVALGNHCLL